MAKFAGSLRNKYIMRLTIEQTALIYKKVLRIFDLLTILFLSSGMRVRSHDPASAVDSSLQVDHRQVFAILNDHINHALA